MAVPTFGAWLDSYDGPDNVVAGVAQLWRTAKSDEDTRPRASAAETVSSWLMEHRGVHEESLRAARRAYNESRQPGRSVTPAEAEQFRRGNEQQPGHGAEQPGWPATPLGHAIMDSQPAGQVPVDLSQLTERQLLLIVLENLGQILRWQADQTARLGPITRLLRELGEAEDQADQIEADPEARYEVNPAWQPGSVPAGGLWGTRAAAPDWQAMHDAGDPADT